MTKDTDGNDYITCEECGHPLERHSMKGCDMQSEGCTCTEAWSYKRIGQERRAAGLPVSFERWKF
jgi:hypothetical protein